MDRKHCDLCNLELGCSPPFFKGDRSWNTLVTSKSNWDYCQKHAKRVEDELWKLKQRLIEEFSKPKGDNI